MSRILIRGGRVLDPSQNLDGIVDVLIEGERVVQVGENLPAGDAQIIDATGLWVVPGLIDVHVHLRTPGETHKETIASGTRAAAAGGFTTVVCMPNTRPPLDNPIVVEWLQHKVAQEGLVRVRVAAAITQGLEGRQLSPMLALRNAGVVAYTDDGRPVSDAGLMLRALQMAAQLELPLLIHAEELSLSGQGAMHQGPVADAAGIPGIPSTAESVMVARDLLLAEQTGAHIHILHVSAEQTASLIRWGKSRGIKVTAEVSPHHLLLCDEDVADSGFDPDWKMNPPLRSAADRDALLEALLDGTIDIIATDHAPHHRDDKEVPFQQAAFGIVGLETAFSLLLDALVPGRLTPLKLVELMSTKPARIFKLDGGSLAPGSPADVAIIDPNHQWTVDPSAFLSASQNTPFAGRRLKGKVVGTLVGGRVVYPEPGFIR